MGDQATVPGGASAPHQAADHPSPYGSDYGGVIGPPDKTPELGNFTRYLDTKEYSTAPGQLIDDMVITARYP